MPDLAGDS